MGKFAVLARSLDDDSIDSAEHREFPATKTFHFFSERQTPVPSGIIERCPNLAKAFNLNPITRLKVKISGWGFFKKTAQPDREPASRQPPNAAGQGNKNKRNPPWKRVSIICDVP